MNILKTIKCEKFIPPKFTWGVDHPDYISPKKRKKQNELITRNPERTTFFFILNNKIPRILSSSRGSVV